MNGFIRIVVRDNNLLIAYLSTFHAVPYKYREFHFTMFVISGQIIWLQIIITEIQTNHNNENT